MYHVWSVFIWILLCSISQLHFHMSHSFLCFTHYFACTYMYKICSIYLQYIAHSKISLPHYICNMETHLISANSRSCQYILHYWLPPLWLSVNICTSMWWFYLMLSKFVIFLQWEITCQLASCTAPFPNATGCGSPSVVIVIQITGWWLTLRSWV